MHFDTAGRAQEAGGVLGGHSTRQCRLVVASVALIAAATLGGCTGPGTSAAGTPKSTSNGTTKAVDSRSPSAPSVSTTRRSPKGRWHLVVRRTPWHLPYPVSRAVATRADGTIVLAGGLNPRGTSRASVVWIRASNGRVVRSGRLPVATHDSAAWSASGTLVVSGGGNVSSIATVQHVLPSGAARVVGTLPRPRSDSVAASVGPTAYIVGGYDGAVLDPAVLASSDGGATFDRVARLPVPVRYAAVATTGATLWVLGGQTAHGLTDVVQRVDTVTGNARIAGRLPSPLDAATAHAIGAKLIVFGGATPNGTTSAILTCSRPAVRCKVTGRLPFAVQNAAAATTGGHTYLLGGERDGVVLDRVVTIDYTRSRAR